MKKKNRPTDFKNRTSQKLTPSVLFKCKAACYFWRDFFLKFMLLGKKRKSQRLSRALLGYMFKDFCSVYGV